MLFYVRVTPILVLWEATNLQLHTTENASPHAFHLLPSSYITSPHPLFIFLYLFYHYPSPISFPSPLSPFPFLHFPLSYQSPFTPFVYVPSPSIIYLVQFTSGCSHDDNHSINHRFLDLLFSVSAKIISKLRQVHLPFIVFFISLGLILLSCYYQPVSLNVTM